jgi:hypothetical protein
MRNVLIVLSMLLAGMTSAFGQVSIDIHLGLFPQLVRVPNYPVYYAPSLQSNFFFFDGMYWVYESDNWYASSWYDGPWQFVMPEFVPLFVLRIPVRYYRNPPMYFRGWRADAPPRWGEHWGNDWERQRRGWDQWNRRSAPAPAPLPIYQRRYSGDHYPRAEQQPALQGQNYRYQPRDPVVRQHFQPPAAQRAPVPAPPRMQQAVPQERSPTHRDVPRSNPPPREGVAVQPSGPAPAQQRGPGGRDQVQPPPGAAPHEQPTPRAGQRNVPQGAAKEPNRGQGHEKDREKDDERGQQRNKP